MAEKFRGKYVTEMTMNEVFDLYNMLRSKKQLCDAEAEWFQICKERIVEHAVLEHEKNNIAIFDTHGGDSTFNKYSGQKVTVIRPLTSDEADIEDVGKMYKIRFADGVEASAFEDELTTIKVSTQDNTHKDDPLLELKVMRDDLMIETNSADDADKKLTYCGVLTHLERAIELVQQVYNDLEINDGNDFSKYTNPPTDAKSGKTLFASVATYTGDGSVNAVLFTSEAAAKADCKKQFESSVAEGKENGDIDPNMESIWHDDEMYGAVYWDDSNTSTFEVKAFVLHDSGDINSDEN